MASLDKCKATFWRLLTVWVILGAVVGCLLGLLFKETNAMTPVFMDVVKTPGDLFTRGLRCILVPFIFCSMIVSVFRLRTVVNGNKIGGLTFSVYLFTTVMAAILAVLTSLVIIVPGVQAFEDAAGVPEEAAAGGARQGAAYDAFKEDCGHKSPLWCKIRGTLDNIVPSSIVDAMASSQLLGVMSFGLLVGALIKPKEDGTSLIVDFADEVQKVMITLMFILIGFTPVAVCSLLCWIVMNYDLSALGEYIGWLLAACFTSQFLQAIVVYPLMYLAQSHPLSQEHHPRDDHGLCDRLLGSHPTLDDALRHGEEQDPEDRRRLRATPGRHHQHGRHVHDADHLSLLARLLPGARTQLRQDRPHGGHSRHLLHRLRAHPQREPDVHRDHCRGRRRPPGRSLRDHRGD